MEWVMRFIQYLIHVLRFSRNLWLSLHMKKDTIKVAGAGFGVDTNVVTFITPDGTRELPLMSKADVADAILDEILQRRAK